MYVLVCARVSPLVNHFLQHLDKYSDPILPSVQWSNTALCTVIQYYPLYSDPILPSVQWSNTALCTVVQYCPLYSGPILPSVQWSNTALCTVIKYCPLYSGPILPSVQWSNTACSKPFPATSWQVQWSNAALFKGSSVYVTWSYLSISSWSYQPLCCLSNVHVFEVHA